MGTLFTNTYTDLDQKSKLFETIQWLLEQKNSSKEKSTSKNIFHFFTKWHFEKFINRINVGYKKNTDQRK